MNYTWDLTTVFASDEEWEKEYERLSKEIDKGLDFAGHLLESAKNLLDITNVALETKRKVEKLYVYASMKEDQDTKVAKYQGYSSMAVSIFAKYNQVYSFYQPEFMKITSKMLDKFENEEPELKNYHHYFEELLAQKEHILSEKEEQLIADATEILGAAGQTFSVLDNADMSFGEISDEDDKKVELTHGNYQKFLESKNREVRKGAYETLYKEYEKFSHTYAKILQTNVKAQNFNAKVRKYSSARQAALSANFIPEKVYDTLVETVNKHLPLLHRYVELRKKILNLPDLKMYDFATPLSKVDLKFTYEEALKKAEQVLSVFGNEYLDIVKEAFTNRWIDVLPNKGKRSGAYSGGAYDTNAFMLLNWQDNIDNLYTLVHEVGHSIHSMFTRKTQPYIYGEYTLFLAEIASTTNENLLTETLLRETKDEKVRFAILNQFLDGFRATVFRQTQFAEFEQEIHKADQNKEVLTSDYLCKTYANINEKYYGLKSEDNLPIQYEWARIPHFYYNFYVYQYATGFSAALALSEKILNGSDEDKKKYLNYLKSGSSDYSLNIIKKAGVDMENADYLNSAFKVFERRLDEFEEMVAKGSFNE